MSVAAIEYVAKRVSIESGLCDDGYCISAIPGCSIDNLLPPRHGLACRGGSERRIEGSIRFATNILQLGKDVGQYGLVNLTRVFLCNSLRFYTHGFEVFWVDRIDL